MVKKRVNKVIRPTKKWHAGPLKGSFMALAIVGFLITIYIVSPRSYNFGIALSLVFIAMFIASVISMTQAPVMGQ